MSAAPIPLPFRKQDVRGELADCRMELAVHKAEELIFVRRFKDDASRVIRLIEGGLLVEAQFKSAELLHAAGRREVQLTASDDDLGGTAA